MLILHAAEEVCAEEGFDELLDGVRGRVDEIESLHRTRELTVRLLSGTRLPTPLSLSVVRCACSPHSYDMGICSSRTSTRAIGSGSASTRVAHGWWRASGTYSPFLITRRCSVTSRLTCDCGAVDLCLNTGRRLSIESMHVQCNVPSQHTRLRGPACR